MSYALSQIAKSSDRTQNNANSLVSGRLNPGNVSTKERREKVAKYLYRKYRRWMKVVKYEVRQRVAT